MLENKKVTVEKYSQINNIFLIFWPILFFLMIFSDKYFAEKREVHARRQDDLVASLISNQFYFGSKLKALTDTDFQYVYLRGTKELSNAKVAIIIKSVH